MLVANCYSCHSAEALANKKLKGGLLLDSREAILRGGDDGPALVPGNPEKSALLMAMRWQGDAKMPPKEQLPKTVIEDFATWIAKGAADPREGNAVPVGTPIDLAAGRAHWAYKPVVAPTLPMVKDTAWPADDLDHFVLARIEAAGLAPAEPASQFELLRRVTYALTGLPPTAEQTDAFLADSAPDAYAKVVDRLLASADYGPHVASRWLDGIRYNPRNYPYNIELYRDWVIRAFNADLPYDRFVAMQFAGDLLPATNPSEHDDNLIAAQVLQLSLRECDPVEGLMQVVGETFLATTLTCAKCHNHKFDLFTQHDYYGIAGIFTSSLVARNRIDDKNLVTLSTGLKVKPLSEGKVADTNLLIRGEKDQPGPVVPRRFPFVLTGDQQVPISGQTKQSGRLELARWIASSENPLAARVMTNRVWQWLTDLPIVGTPSDFGTTGEAPVDQALLDHLASRFVARNWSLKALTRAIVLSSTFRQSSRPRPAALERDSRNKLFSRMEVRRLTCEEIFDSLHRYGAGLRQDFPPQPVARDTPGFGGKKGGAVYRAIFQPNAGLGDLFDGRNGDTPTDNRQASVQPRQISYLIDSKRNAMASDVAALVIAKAKDPDGQIRQAYRLCYGRDPSPEEIIRGVKFIASAKGSQLAMFCATLIGANEFIYLR
ncbi:hypothetical protein LBMAG53_21560 [Planctomycetota bacterium]|nr:hypothetical protein LBMAG53_21560 [Planctomycetota bacterium]